MQPATIEQLSARFKAFVAELEPDQPVAVLCHSDADGLAAGAILTRALRRVSHTIVVEVTAKGEHAWSPSVRERLMRHDPQALIVTDLGSRDASILDVPTLLIDHHRPEGVPPRAELLTGYGLDPMPTSGLMAFWCAQGIANVQDLDWIAAISLLSDVGDNAPFDLLTHAKERYRPTPLRDATTLINAPRRSASGDARPALDLLIEVDHPREIVRGARPEVARLKAAKAEVNAAFAEAKRAAPVFSGKVALIQIHTACQVHPLIAQIWRTRLPSYIVLAANTGYLPGRVNFSARTTGSINLLDFLRQHAPADAGDSYGRGHDQASGGSLSYSAWNELVSHLGFGPAQHVAAAAIPGADA